MSMSNPLSQASGFTVEIAILDIGLIQELCTGFDTFKQISKDGQAPSIWPNWTFAKFFGVSGSHGSTSPIAPVTSRDKNAASNKHRTMDPEPKVEELRSLCETLHAILDLLGASPFRDQGAAVPQGKKVLLTDIAHYIALAVQFISLTIQSYVRKSMGNPEFVFLDPPLDSIILEGISLEFRDVRGGSGNPRHFRGRPPCIAATSQQLSCLSEMVFGKVLVFGPHGTACDRASDVHSTLVNLDELWGPVQLIAEVSC
jgi:hypothetical protein